MRLPSALRRLGSLVAKDLVVVARNHYVTVVLALAVLYALAVHFVLPASVGGASELIVLDRTPGQTLGRAYAAAAPGRVELVGSEAALEEALRRGGARIGVTVDGSLADGGAGPVHVTVVFQGFESPRVRQVVTAAVRAQLAALTGRPPAAFPTERLRPEAAAQRPPFNLSLLPILVWTEAAFLGLFLAASLLFVEKHEGTVRALRVTPVQVAEYLAARSVTMGLLGVAFTVVLTLATRGLDVTWPGLLGTVFLYAAVVTLTTLAVANLFGTMSQFLFTGIVVNLVLSLPAIGYWTPGFNPGWLKLIPTYPLLYGLREAYFPSGAAGVVRDALVQLSVATVVVFVLAAWAFAWQSRREVA
ncbi:MAG: ABC transporter permease [Firmicutes bacterium]|nr:ABC transporter permease [Bacillota bacterium]